MNENRKSSGPFRLRVWGENACFTRPEMKVERVSYDVMTPSAARGVLEAILWKPAMRWVVERIDVLAPIRWESVRRNEVGSVASASAKELFIEEKRQQRAGLFLRNVDYLVHARFEMTDKAGPEDSVTKFQEMFLRRAEKGQCFHRPYLGCREFAAEFQFVRLNEPLPETIAETRDLGWMLHDIQHDGSKDKNHVHFCVEGCRPAFFRAAMENGVIRVPPLGGMEVRQ